MRPEMMKRVMGIEPTRFRWGTGIQQRAKSVLGCLDRPFPTVSRRWSGENLHGAVVPLYTFAIDRGAPAGVPPDLMASLAMFTDWHMFTSP